MAGFFGRHTTSNNKDLVEIVRSPAVPLDGGSGDYDPLLEMINEPSWFRSVRPRTARMNFTASAPRSPGVSFV